MELAIRPEGVELSPTTRRVEKILGQIDDALCKDSLSPDEAWRLAGRLTFLSQSTFGSTGRAAIKPLYARAADTTLTIPCPWAFGPLCRPYGAWWMGTALGWSPGRGG